MTAATTLPTASPVPVTGGVFAFLRRLVREKPLGAAGGALLLFFPLHPVLALFALFLFNMSMPLTLFASSRLLRGAKGCAFGLLTAALYVGIVPFFLGARFPSSNILYGTLAAVSGILLVIGLKEPKCRIP